MTILVIAEHDGGIAGCPGDGRMKLAIRQLALLLRRLLVGHFDHERLQVNELFVGNQRSRQRSHLTLKQSPRFGLVMKNAMTALEAAGVLFIDAERGRGVMLLSELPPQSP